MKKYGWRYAPGVFFLIACSYVQTLAPLVLGRAVDLLRESPINRDALFHETVMIVAIAAGVFATRFLWRYFIIGNARNVEYWLRGQLFAHLQRMPVDFMNRQKSGDLMAYAINDINAVRMMFGPAVAQLLNGVGTGLFAVLSMTSAVDPALALYALLPVPFALIAVWWIGRRVQRKFRRVQDLFAGISGTVNENIAGMRVIKSFALEDSRIEAFQAQSDEMRRANVKLADTSSLLEPLIKTLFGASFLVSMILGGHMALDGRISLGSFVAFNGYLLLIVQPVLSMGRVINLMQRGMASLKRLNTLLDAPPIPAEEDRPLDGEISYSVEARDLSFTYPGGQTPSLEGVSFRLEPGQTLGIAGPTGAGKTTIVNLLLKLYEAPAGALFVGGCDIRELPARGLRDRVAYVPQDGFLFNATVEENIRFYQDATRGDVERAAGEAGLSSDLAGFPEGYATVVGERGSHLSGGQRQRVAIARALVRKPSLLILDDALSAVDTETERRILENLRQSGVGRTTVIISHRLSVLAHADLILYLEDGKVTERGCHSELLQLGGAYARLWNEQAANGGEG